MIDPQSGAIALNVSNFLPISELPLAVVNGIACNGSEDSLLDCFAELAEEPTCNPEYYAEVVCQGTQLCHWVTLMHS